MALVPFSYNLRSLWVRKSATFLTVLGLGATVAVVAGVLALQQGFATLFSEGGREDVVIFLREGATREGDSSIRRETAAILTKERPEIAVDADGVPLATGEIALAIRLEKIDGGETNVPIRGVGEASYAIHADAIRYLEGRRPDSGADEIMVGSKLAKRIQNCLVGDVLTINVTPFRVVGVFDNDGPFASEIWGDVERMSAALQRQNFNRVIAKVRPNADVEGLKQDLENDKQAASNVFTEREFMANQTGRLSAGLFGLVFVLALIMGIAAVFTAANTMLAALSARTKEIGILKSIGFRPLPIFVAFLLEALLLGLFGGLLGSALVLPLNGIETGTTNWDTFTEIAFAFRITPRVLGTAIVYALALGLLGGAWPAWRASRMTPVEALRRG